MHPYLPHLLSDITAAHFSEQSIPATAKTFEEEMEEIEQWVAGKTAPYTFGYWCGLSAENFPPAAQLTDADLLLVCEAMSKMMNSYNIAIDLPGELPTPLKYDFTLSVLTEKIAIPISGIMHYDFCTGNAPDCAFKEYCPCLKYWNELEDDEIAGH